MDWILRNIPLLVVLFVVFQIVRAVLQAKKAQEQERGQQDETEQQRRIREVQEQIRRKIAQRRGELPPATPPPVIAREAPAPRAEPPPLDPFGGPVRRVLEEIERRLQPPAPPVLTHSRAELERQARLEDDLAAAEEAHLQAKRRALHAAAERAEVAKSEMALLTSARARLLADLSEPQSLRRAFVLREVLGPPVALR